MAKFFIDRPIFAWVIAIFIMVIGALSITQLPIAQYPTVAPPAVVVSATYPGAAAQTPANSAARHTHENKGVLDGITAARAAAWDAKVSPAALGPAVNTALQGAKDPGAFRGDKGDPGEKGEPGAPGKTPVRGTDYWTVADKQEIVNSVIAALPDGTEVSY